MILSRKNYYTKGPGSIALLTYYVVLPLHSPYGRISALADRCKLSIKEVHSILSNIFNAVQDKLQASLLETDKLFDDGVVELRPFFLDTHASIYMKLPATLPVHGAIVQIKMLSSALLLESKLLPYRTVYKTLWGPNYLALCGALDPFYAKDIEPKIYEQCIQAFKLENSLEGHMMAMSRVRKQVLGQTAGFINPENSVYK